MQKTKKPKTTTTTTMTAISAELKDLLLEIEKHHVNYDRRYGLVIQAMGLAQKEKFKVGIRVDPDEDPNKWLVVAIHLPTGILTWHMPADTVKWDGSTAEQMYDKVREMKVADEFKE